MQPVEAILFEPVGCLAEFPAEPFIEIAARVFGRKRKPSRSASRAYWHLLNLMEGAAFDAVEAETLEIQAVEAAIVYEDVAPALAELSAQDVRVALASSLSEPAVRRFAEKCPGFASVWSRDTARGVKDLPLRCAVRAASLAAERTLFLTDTAEGLATARGVGLNPVLMMNDPDEAQRLALQGPAGGIVSLHELPDFVRLVAARNG